MSRQKSRTRRAFLPTNNPQSSPASSFEDSHTLSDYNIQKGPTLHHVLHLQWNAVLCQGINQLAKPSPSKTMSRQKIQDKEGIPHNQQHLIFTSMVIPFCQTIISRRAHLYHINEHRRK
jgi:hypothetical protein